MSNINEFYPERPHDKVIVICPHCGKKGCNGCCCKDETIDVPYLQYVLSADDSVLSTEKKGNTVIITPNFTQPDTSDNFKLVTKNTDTIKLTTTETTNNDKKTVTLSSDVLISTVSGNGLKKDSEGLYVDVNSDEIKNSLRAIQLIVDSLYNSGGITSSDLETFTFKDGFNIVSGNINIFTVSENSGFYLSSNSNKNKNDLLFGGV